MMDAQDLFAFFAEAAMRRGPSGLVSVCVRSHRAGMPLELARLGLVVALAQKALEDTM